MSVGSTHLREAEIVVIGAGVVGAALSYRLAQAGARVTTVDRSFPGSGTSQASFAWLNGFSKTPRHYHRLNVQGIRDHEDLADELGGDWVHVDGALHWAREDDTVAASRLRDIIHRLREWGVRIDTFTPEAAMRELEPDLWIDPETVSEVYYLPREGWLEAIPMAHGVLRAAQLRYGAHFERGTVVGLRGPSGSVDGVALEDGRELPADVVINAAGPEAARIGELAGVRVAIDRQIGMTISTAPAPVGLKRVVYGSSAHVRPDGGGRLVVARDYLDSHAVEGQPTPPDAEVVRRCMDDARAIVPGLAEIPAERVRIGVRPMPRDGNSIVGFEPSVSGLYTVVTHSGVSLAARLALLVTEELSGGDTAELEPYRPSRFLETAPA